MSESTNQTCNWEMVGLGVQWEFRGEETAGLEGGRVQVPRVARPQDSPCAPQNAPIPLWSSRTPAASTMQRGPLRTARKERPLEISQKFLKKNIQLGALSRVLTFLTSSRRRSGGPEPRVASSPNTRFQVQSQAGVSGALNLKCLKNTLSFIWPLQPPISPKPS